MASRGRKIMATKLLQGPPARERACGVQHLLVRVKTFHSDRFDRVSQQIVLTSVASCYGDVGESWRRALSGEARSCSCGGGCENRPAVVGKQQFADNLLRVDRRRIGGGGWWVVGGGGETESPIGRCRAGPIKCVREWGCGEKRDEKFESQQ